MKKLISFVLSLCMVCLSVSFSSPAFAENEALVLSVGTIAAKSTETATVSVPVTLDKNEQGFIDFQFTVTYDNEVLQGMSASIPNDSVLMYTPDLRDPETKEKPYFASHASQADGEVRFVVMGVTCTDENGDITPHVFTETGNFITLKFKFNSDLSELPSALSSIKISKDDSVFTPLLFHYENGSEIPHDSIQCNSGGIKISDCTSPDKITLTPKGSLEQSSNLITAVSFTAQFEASSCYALDATKWYVNDTLVSDASGRVFSFTPTGSGNFTVQAKNGDTVSDAVTVKVSASATHTPFVPMTTPPLAPSSEFEYEILNKQAVITKYIGSAPTVIVPASLSGYPVCKIGHGAFSGRKDVLSVSLPEGIDEIMAEAFKDCSALTRIVLPKSLYFIQSNAFEGCSGLERVDMLNSFVWIYSNAFLNAKKLESIYCYTETPLALEKDAFKGTSSALTLYYRNDFAQYWSPNGETTYADIPILPFEISGLILNSDSGYAILGNVLTGVEPKTTVAELISAFQGGSITVTDENGNVLDIDDIVVTGAKIKLVNGGEVLDELTVAVKGDVNGDGNANSRDIAMLQRHILGTAALEGICFTAGDINSDNKLNSRDISALQKILLG